ncbi:MAG: GNAT family N-acetyltransferase [Prolixibacteraceae bacterium]|nr:GNAT family N-acetyltransferase [Prolixibacteraceae bacterium]
MLNINISKFNPIFLEQLNNLSPEEWQSDAYQLFLQNEWQPWFYPFQATYNNSLVGFGMFCIFKQFAWLGWILVHENYRNQGIGTKITKHLITEAQKKGALNFILTASDLGLPIYSKLGFKITSRYIFFNRPEKKFSNAEKKHIRKAVYRDIENVSNLDLKATGEDRSIMIENFADDIWLHDNNGIKGFYIPSLGNGYIVACDQKTGIELINFKCNKDEKPVIVPEENSEAINFLKSSGFKEYLIVPRMTLNKEPDWNPKMIFNRGTGYCG